MTQPFGHEKLNVYPNGMRLVAMCRTAATRVCEGRARYRTLDTMETVA